MEDGFGRSISYLRVSVTDRCDYRCVYCMDEDAVFSDRAGHLSWAEMERLCAVFIGLGVRKIRLTGGEPLVARGVMDFVAALGGKLPELTLTTNGSQLAKHAAGLAAAGVKRLNVSLDSLDPARFKAITRGGRLGDVLAGIDAAQAMGLAVKINTVALKGVNDDEFDALLVWCGARGADLCLIETMPMGEVAHRAETHLPLGPVRAALAARWTLLPSTHLTGGPARYWRVAETGARLGFITPLSAHFCDSCNRVRLTREGLLYLCLGHDDALDLRTPLRAGASDAALADIITAGLHTKPQRHLFDITRPAVARAMSVTGG